MIALAIACGSIEADTIYTSASAFAAATSGVTTIGFGGILPAGTSFEDFNPLTVAGNTFSTPIAGVFVNVTTADFYSPSDYPADFIVNSAHSGSNELDITFASAVHAVALDYGGFSGGGDGKITLSDGTVFDQASLPGLAHTDFVGFVSSTALTGLKFTTTSDAWVVEDLKFATPTPEPIGVSAIGFAGVVAIAAWRRRKKSA